ncbi:Hypothetical protein R9X50_00731400 [Acrodontium crateriforme]|uniref:NACHT domain-containing protein n=1 Tax=Acrodontium crateriforme TaxID=150365 RepID=A0AAQ3RE31_9PEZI|nr:Hypothetical protein R9X50_00731400 [Acrodontium crateriforme]
MRLLNVHNFKFTEFRDDNRPNYVIASHRWFDGCEATFQDVRDGYNCDKAGYDKIKAFAEYVRKNVQSVEWLWIDTCCINKDSAAELSEAINLMFDWYRNAELCIAYLADVESTDDRSRFERSEWFERGWTLQELLAPRMVIFVTKSWQVIGNRGGSTLDKIELLMGPNLETEIARITRIPEDALQTFDPGRRWTVDERLRWMDGRKTTREEDMFYALYGIFGVTPGANYGERRDGAKQRLLAAINHQETIAAQKAERYREIADWLSPPDPWTNHESARRQKEPQTGTWLLDYDKYRNWKSGSFRHLWLSGQAGCGKTVLCSTAIEDVKAHCENAVNAGYAFFYFTFSDNQKKLYENLLLSAVVQLGVTEPGRSMLQQAFGNNNRGRPGQDELEKILLSCIGSYDELFIVLDALDECPEDNDGRQRMLTWLTQLSQEAPQLKILATSRELPDIQNSMAPMGAVRVSIASHLVDADIRKHVETQLSRDHRLVRLQSTTKALIEETICTKSNGMFRWAHCQLQELKKLKSTRPRFVKDALYSLPSTLDETYERMLIGIDARLRADALTLLRWLAYAKSPPSLGELVDATVIDLEGEGNVEVEDRPGLDDTLEILSSLVIIIGREGDEDANHVEDADSESDASDIRLAHRLGHITSHTRVRLAHFSVKEYLESPRILGSSAQYFHLESAREHSVLSQSCLVYLMHYSSCQEKLLAKKDFETFPLLGYAAESWYYHSALQKNSQATREIDLLCNETILRDWLRVHKPDQSYKDSFSELEQIASSLYYASFLGLEEVAGQLLINRADVDAQGGYYGNALQAAAMIDGHEKIVQMLLDAGADVNAQGGYYGNALQAAVLDGHEKIVQMLLDAGADVNAQREYYGNALQAAMRDGREKIAQMLLDSGANVNAQGGYYGNALQAAVLDGHEKIVQMLLDAGADVNAQGGYCGNALQAAVLDGHEKIVQMLLDAGADVNAQGGYCGNALQAAILGGHEKIVQMLLDAGADVNAQGGHYGNAL